MMVRCDKRHICKNKDCYHYLDHELNKACDDWCLILKDMIDDKEYFGSEYTSCIPIKAEDFITEDFITEEEMKI